MEGEAEGDVAPDIAAYMLQLLAH